MSTKRQLLTATTCYYYYYCHPSTTEAFAFRSEHVCKSGFLLFLLTTFFFQSFCLARSEYVCKWRLFSNPLPREGLDPPLFFSSPAQLPLLLPLPPLVLLLLRLLILYFYFFTFTFTFVLLFLLRTVFFQFHWVVGLMMSRTLSSVVASICKRTRFLPSKSLKKGSAVFIVESTAVQTSSSNDTE